MLNNLCNVILTCAQVQAQTFTIALYTSQDAIKFARRQINNIVSGYNDYRKTKQQLDDLGNVIDLMITVIYLQTV